MRFGYMIVYVADVARSVAFYESAFGAKARFIHESGQYAELETGTTTLAFANDDFVAGQGVAFRRTRADEPPPAVEIGLVFDDVAAAYRRAVEAGAAAIKEPAAKPWGQIVGYVRDANGVLVELCSPMG
jgi:lactoylglutathione lyase